MLPNQKLAYGAKVEIKAGSLYQKQTYAGVPLHFGMGLHKEAETVRITWPNGMIQNQVNPRGGQALEIKYCDPHGVIFDISEPAHTWKGIRY